MLTVRHPGKRPDYIRDGDQRDATDQEVFRQFSQASRYDVEQFLLSGEEEPKGETQ